jgi:hypothetical protein
MLDKPKTGAQRAARHRQRRKEGVEIFPIEVDSFSTIAALIDRRRVTEQQSRDRRAIATALGQIVAEWVSKNSL